MPLTRPRNDGEPKYQSKKNKSMKWTGRGMPDALPVNDDEGNTIYYRFRTDVENSSGLLNLVAAPITVSLDTII